MGQKARPRNLSEMTSMHVLQSMMMTPRRHDVYRLGGLTTTGFRGPKDEPKTGTLESNIGKDTKKKKTLTDMEVYAELVKLVGPAIAEDVAFNQPLHRQNLEWR